MDVYNELDIAVPMQPEYVRDMARATVRRYSTGAEDLALLLEATGLDDK